MRSLRSVFTLFPHARARGLTDAEVLDSRGRFGANRLTPLPREPVWKKFLEKFDDAIIKILLAASLLKIVVDLFTIAPKAGGLALGGVALAVSAAYLLRLRAWVPSLLFVLSAILFVLSWGLGHPSIEGLAVMIAIALATGVAFLAEYRSDREFEKLNAQKDSIRVKVNRGGAVTAMALEEVVVGDLVMLETGDEIPADGRLTAANELLIDQSLMTGESEAVRKGRCAEDEETDGPDKVGCVYRGTQVVDGLGEMIVSNVGDDTMIGQIARRLSGDHADQTDAADARVQRKLTLSKEQTPLQGKLSRLAGVISKVGYAAAVAIFLALLARGLFFATDPDTGRPEVFLPATGEETVAVAQYLLKYVVYMVIVIVVAVPEGLPMSVTVSLALAMRKMTRANALVRQLVATETIGSATVICSDKTGTLTQNKMRVVRVAAGGESAELGAPDFVPSPALRTPTTARDWLALNAAVNGTATLEEKEGKTVVVGSGTEGGLLLWLKDGGLSYAELRATVPLVYRTAFSSEHKRMTTVVEANGRAVSLVKGAPEVVLARCTRVLDADGSARDLTDEDRARILGGIGSASADAMRTLAFAQVELPADFPRDPEAMAARRGDLETGLTFTGFVAIRDPLRDDVKDAIDRCRSAGIDVKMITGDNVDTARAIARELGMLDAPDAVVLTSDEFGALSDDELKAKLPFLRVLARAKPLDKYRIVQLLQEQNQVVAMTGDGTNDAPSLKKADVGLAMGIAGTEVAKEASKIVLLDDSFGTIVHAVHWGRALYENIQRFIVFQLTINVSALAIAFLGPFVGAKPPFTVLQLLWINVIMDTFAAIALCSESPRPGLMTMRPKRRDESIVTPSMLKTILATAGFFVVVMLALLIGMTHAGWFRGDGPMSDEFRALSVRQVALFFTVYVFFQVWNQINCRSLTPTVSGLWGLHRNPLFLAIASLTVIGQVLIIRFGGRVFAVEPLAVLDWLVIAAATASVLVFAEVARLLRKGRPVSIRAGSVSDGS